MYLDVMVVVMITFSEFIIMHMGLDVPAQSGSGRCGK